MPRYRRGNEIVDAIRYQPGHGGHIIHRLSETGIPCLHLQPDTETISIFDPDGTIDIQDPRRDFDSAEGVVQPGDWVVWRNLLALEIVPSQVFAAEYALVL